MMDVEQIVRELAVASPSLAVYVLGGIAAILRWGRHPGASLWALLGLGVLFLAYAGSLAARTAILAMPMDDDFERIGALFMLVGVANGIAHAVGIALLLAAAFAGRGDAGNPFSRSV